MRSTNAGMPRSVVAISFSSSCAGTTTPTRLPSSIAATKPGGEAVPEERGERAEDEPDQRGDDHGVAAAARRHLLRRRARQD